MKRKSGERLPRIFRGKLGFRFKERMYHHGQQGYF